MSMETMEFTQMTPMSGKRFSLAVVVLGGYIYAIGGFGSPVLNTVER